MAFTGGLLKTRVLNVKSFVIQPSRQLKSILKIKWVRPEKIPCIKPEQSGDLKPLGTVDLAKLPTTHKDAEELKSASEIVQRLFTLEFFPRFKLKEEFLHEYTNRVKAHRLDDDSPEYKIAELTVTIRNLQIHMDTHPTDKCNKKRLKEIIDLRNKRLTRLQRTDYKKYEWLLEKLDLQHKVYHGMVGYERHFGYETVERKKSLRRLTALFIEKLKQEKLDEYKTFLEGQKEGFFNHKVERLMWIKRTEEELGLPATVTEADIQAAQLQLRDVQVVQPKAVNE